MDSIWTINDIFYIIFKFQHVFHTFDNCQLQLATFQMLDSHTLLLTTGLANAELDSEYRTK